MSEKIPCKELSYEDAIAYYQILQYNYSEGKNSQASENFVRRRAFEYITVVFLKIKSKIHHPIAFLMPASIPQSDDEIRIIDSFTIKK